MLELVFEFVKLFTVFFVGSFVIKNSPWEAFKYIAWNSLASAGILATVLFVFNRLYPRLYPLFN